MGWKHLGLLYEAGDFLGTFLDQGGGLGLLAMGDWTEPRRPHSLPSFLSISILWKRFKIILHGHDCRFLCQFTSLGRKRLSPGGSWDGEEVLGREGTKHKQQKKGEDKDEDTESIHVYDH